MKTHEQFADDLALYALNDLQGADRQELETHLETCASCRRELQALRSDLGLLGLSSGGPQPPSRSKDRLMRAIAAEPRGASVPSPAAEPKTSWWSSLIPALAALCLLIVAVALWHNNGRLKDAIAELHGRNEDQATQLDQMRREMALMTAPDAVHVSLSPQKVGKQPNGTAIFSPARKRMMFMASNLAPVPAIGGAGFDDVLLIRGNNLDGDQARYNRFRDLRDGVYLDRFRLDKETETWLLRGEAENVGYRDQRFGVELQDIGRLKVDFDWNQIPLSISGDTRSLYTDKGGGVLSIDPGLRQAIQDATALGTVARDAALSSALAQASQFQMRSRRDVGTVNLVYTLNRDIDIKFNVRNTNRNGHNLMSFGFGNSPGLNPAVELGAPTDDRTTNFKGALEFANARGLLSIGSSGSSYNNRIASVRFDNPLRATDSATLGPASGLTPLWPSNSAFSVNLNG